MCVASRRWRVPGTLAEPVLALWLLRTPEQQSLKAMGYVAGADLGGFRYNWLPWGR